MQITIGGMPGSGKSTIGKMLAKSLGYKYYSIGEIRRELAQKRGLTIIEYNELKEDTDKEADDFQKNELAKKDNIIVEGRLAFHFLPKSTKLFFDVDLKVAAKRIFLDPRSSEKKYSSETEVYKDLKRRMDNDIERYLDKYDIDAFNKKNFDHVIDTADLSLEQAGKKALGILGVKLRKR